MGKRSSFDRVPQDKYMTTDPWPVRRLQAHLPRHVVFAEPCAGNGDIVEQMKWFGHRCAYACDIKPGKRTIEKRDALTLDGRWRRGSGASMFVTNPPWSRDALHPMILHLSSILPTWLLLDASWAFTKQAGPYLERCRKIVAIGRVRWIQESDHMGKDDCAWYLFSDGEGRTEFYGLTS